MDQATVTLFVGGLGIFGTLAGVISGHFLGRSWQREQWLLDNRRQEYRELIHSITGAYMALAHIREEVTRGRPVTEEISLQAERAKIESFCSIRDRILIADDVALANVLEEWKTAVKDYLKNTDIGTFEHKFMSINARLVQMACVPAKSSLGKSFSSWRLGGWPRSQ